jgi:hypothetical protein
MSGLPPLGDGGMDMPYEANPDVAHITEAIDGHTYPALLFRFALPDGQFLPAVTLVCMPAHGRGWRCRRGGRHGAGQLEALIPLVQEAVAGAVKAAAA